VVAVGGRFQLLGRAGIDAIDGLIKEIIVDAVFASKYPLVSESIAIASVGASASALGSRIGLSRVGDVITAIRP
jgi:hypothetical protein